MTEDAWVISAMNDDAMVAELLLRIKHSSADDRIPVLPMLPPIRWGNYKLRSAVAKKEKSEPMRCSPKTPLSWSGGGTGGGGTSASDLCEESSRGSDGKSIGRSKIFYSVSICGDPPRKLMFRLFLAVTAGGAFCIDNNGSNSDIDKRCRKKMGFSELKEEEMLQMKKNIHLKKEIAKLRMTVEEQKDENQSLKRMKMSDGFLLQSSLEERRDGDGRKFVLPDLNLRPVEEDDDNSWRL